MKFGLFYLFSDFGDIPQDRIFNEVLEEIEFGEELGFDSKCRTAASSSSLR